MNVLQIKQSTANKKIDSQVLKIHKHTARWKIRTFNNRYCSQSSQHPKCSDSRKVSNTWCHREVSEINIIIRTYTTVSLDFVSGNIETTLFPYFPPACCSEIFSFCCANIGEPLCPLLYPGDLDTRKSTGTSCQIEIHFMIKTTEYLL